MARGSLAPWLFVVASLIGCGTDDAGSTGGSGGAGGAAGSGGAAGACSDVATGADAFPCDVEAILVTRCQRCHTTDDVLDRCAPNNECARGPFPLLKWSDTRASYGSKKVYEYIADVVERKFMPLNDTSLEPPVQTLTDAEIETLAGWARSCAPSGTAACD